MTPWAAGGAIGATAPRRRTSQLTATGAMLIYRALRPSLESVTACVAASFPSCAESTRTLVG